MSIRPQVAAAGRSAIPRGSTSKNVPSADARRWPAMSDIIFQLAEVAVPRGLFDEILQRIERLRPQPPPLVAWGRITK
jgi:hypothetical protein